MIVLEVEVKRVARLLEKMNNDLIDTDLDPGGQETRKITLLAWLNRIQMATADIEKEILDSMEQFT